MLKASLNFHKTRKRVSKNHHQKSQGWLNNEEPMNSQSTITVWKEAQMDRIIGKLTQKQSLESGNHLLHHFAYIQQFFWLLISSFPRSPGFSEYLRTVKEINSCWDLNDQQWLCVLTFPCFIWMLNNVPTISNIDTWALLACQLLVWAFINALTHWTCITIL